MRTFRGSRRKVRGHYELESEQPTFIGSPLRPCNLGLNIAHIGFVERHFNALNWFRLDILELSHEAGDSGGREVLVGVLRGRQAAQKEKKEHAKG